MRGDFSRDTFDPLRRFSRVLMQQGRVQLDADWNEQAAIQLHLLRSLAADLIGPHGGPGDSFRIRDKDPVTNAAIKNDFLIDRGHYYVDGWLCENHAPALFHGTQYRDPQPSYPEVPELEDGKRYLAYLDVWERHLSYAETDGKGETDLRTPPFLRELALGGADTTSRAEVVWQVKVREVTAQDIVEDNPTTVAEWREWLEKFWKNRYLELWQPARRGRLKAEARKSDSDDDKCPCAISPESRFRGLENQLYRVEIHRPGPAKEESGGTSTNLATFKWSRENGSVLFPIEDILGTTIKLAAWWRDDRFGLTEGNWVEVADDRTALQNRADTLRRVTRVERETLSVTLDAPPTLTLDLARHPVLRRWDHRARASGKVGGSYLATDNAIDLVENTWISLEDGVRVMFEKAANAPQNLYRTGDQWLIPARTAIGDVVWPRQKDLQGGTEPRFEPPHGVYHHFAPLAIVDVDGTGTATVTADLRRSVAPLGQPIP